MSICHRTPRLTFFRASPSVIRRTLEVYHNILQRKELEAAGIQGLESCPACEYAVVIENENEKLFRCEMEDCGLVSCRACRREVSRIVWLN
jgi:hypothetical protein